MTAVVGILNKQGVSIAADSAVTVSGASNRKIYNSANKIFTLSKYHPVGIAIYNSSQVMGIPWEILIKEYRKQLDKRSFEKLSDYKNDFFAWLNSKQYFLESTNKNYILTDLFSFIRYVLSTPIFQEGLRLGKDKEQLLIESLNLYISTESAKETLESLKEINEDNVKQLIKLLIPSIIDSLNKNFNVILNEENLKTSLTEAYYQYLLHDKFIEYTGLIFTGYGEDEIFPKLITVNVSIVVDGKLRLNEAKNKNVSISNNNSSSIMPFAQTDVIDTVLRGVSPELQGLSTQVFEKFLSQFMTEIKGVPNMPSNVLSALDKVDTRIYVKMYQDDLRSIIQNRYVNPLVNAVAQLSKEDLAEMAESLVYLTYLKRRFTMAEESVGGPVDVAIITKGDGFIWIKRKYYFDPELNQSFFNKYL